MPTEKLTRAPFRIRLALIIILGVGAVLGARLYYWQVVQSDRLLRLAERQSTIDVPIPARRGEILTSDGLHLATDIFVYTIRTSPKGIADKVAFAKEMAPLLKQTPEAILQTLGTNDNYVILARDVPVEIGEAVQDFKSRNESKRADLGLINLTIEIRSVRQYPAGAFAAPIVGYVNAEGNAAYGIEQSRNEEMRGIDGKLHGAGDALRDMIPIDLPTNEPAIDGSTIVLTIDSAIQKIAETELANGVRDTKAASGSVVILDPKTGAVLAMAIYPTADLNAYFQPQNVNRYVNTTISSLYEPGSTFKVITLSAGLDAGTINLGSAFDDNGYLQFGGVLIRNHNNIAPGRVNLVEVMTKSLNVEAAKIAVGLGVERFYQYIHKFGFGVPTRIELAGEAGGMVKSPGDGIWRDSDLATNAFGQGISVTPLQLAVAVAAVGNEGKVMRPYIIQQVRRPDGITIKTQPLVIRQAISPETARAVTEVLSQSIIAESTNKALVTGYSIAGKTGTASIPTMGGYDPIWTIASFIGFIPAKEPRFLILVKLDKPQTSEWGSQVASPIFASIARQLVTLVGLPPDAVRLSSK